MHISRLTQLTQLTLSHNKTPDHTWCPGTDGNVPGVHARARCLRSMPLLQRLGPQELCINIDDATTVVLGSATKSLLHLTRVDLGCQPYVTRGDFVSSHGIAQQVRIAPQLPAIKHIDLSGCGYELRGIELFEAAGANREALERLRLEDTSIWVPSDAAVEAQI
jgi:hypothetical protein